MPYKVHTQMLPRFPDRPIACGGSLAEEPQVRGGWIYPREEHAAGDGTKGCHERFCVYGILGMCHIRRYAVKSQHVVSSLTTCAAVGRCGERNGSIV